jgi:hypothetical protein
MDEKMVLELLIRLVDAVEHMAYGDDGDAPEDRPTQSLSDRG